MSGFENLVQSEFFWGLIIGLILSLVGCFFQAKIAHDKAKAYQRHTVMLFCSDVVRNLKSIIGEMQATRQRAQMIHHDFLDLIELEVTVFGRNREHLIYVDDNAREIVRKFMNEVAIRRGEIARSLNDFYQQRRLLQEAEKMRDEEQQFLARQNSKKSLEDANRAADTLVQLAATTDGIIQALARK